MITLAGYSSLSILGSLLVTLYAYSTRVRFYPTLVFLFTSKLALVSTINLGLVFVSLIGVGCVKLFLGRLRDAETEAVWENMRFSITETAFALTTFRDELNFRVGVLFAVMLFAKVFHLLNEARVEYVEQANQTTWLTHARTVGLSMFLMTLDSAVLAGCVWHLHTYGTSVYLLFAFEHAVLVITLIATVCRYAIACYDLNYVQGRWQNKSHYEMYIALVSEALQFVAYFNFACVVFVYYGLPIHLLRQLYVTFRNVVDRATHFIRFRKLVNSLNERFPDATSEELANTDRVCIICREEMEDGHGGHAGAAKKLQCGHLFHSFCLQNWLERQFSCPTCRAPIPIGAVPVGVAAAQAVPAVPIGGAAVQAVQALPVGGAAAQAVQAVPVRGALAPRAADAVPVDVAAVQAVQIARAIAAADQARALVAAMAAQRIQATAAATAPADRQGEQRPVERPPGPPLTEAEERRARLRNAVARRLEYTEEQVASEGTAVFGGEEEKSIEAVSFQPNNATAAAATIDQSPKPTVTNSVKSPPIWTRTRNTTSNDDVLYLDETVRSLFDEPSSNSGSDDSDEEDSDNSINSEFDLSSAPGALALGSSSIQKTDRRLELLRLESNMYKAQMAVAREANKLASKVMKISSTKHRHEQE